LISLDNVVSIKLNISTSADHIYNICAHLYSNSIKIIILKNWAADILIKLKIIRVVESKNHIIHLEKEEMSPASMSQKILFLNLNLSHQSFHQHTILVVSIPRKPD